MRPSHYDFEDCGAIAALRRLFKGAGGFELPGWVLSPRLEYVAGSDAELGCEEVRSAEARALAARLARFEGMHGSLKSRKYMHGQPPSVQTRCSQATHYVCCSIRVLSHLLRAGKLRARVAITGVGFLFLHA